MDTNNFKIEKKKGSVVEITGEIAFTELESHRNTAIKSLGKDIQIKGFRKGNVPEKVLIEKIGEGTILQEMAELTIRETYPKIIIENKLNPIAQPNITITKLAPKNPLEFKIEIVVMPEFEIADYKNLAKDIKRDEIKVEKKEIEDTLEQVLESKKENDKKPELTDEFAKSLGDFKSVADLKEKIEESIKFQKEGQAKDKHRVAILESIIAETQMDLPEIIMESELQKMMMQFRVDVEHMGMNWEEYIKKINKTEDDLKKEWRADAEKRAKSQMILNKIAIEENLVADEKDVEHETEHLLSHHPKANKENVRVYAEQMLTNEKVFKFLEKSSK